MAGLTDVRRDELVAEREFLVRSLADLESERDEGGIDAATFATLHSDYTARTAAVLRLLGGAADTRPKKAPIPKERRMFAYVAIAVFAVGLAFALAKSAGTRAPGGALTGKTPGQVDPNSFDGHVESARQLQNAGRFPDALVEYTAAQKLEPSRADVRVEFAQMLIAWIRSDSKPDPKEVGLKVVAAEAALDRALTIDPQYASAYAFKGVVLLQFRGEPAKAKPFFEKYLAIAPNGIYEPMARSLLAGLATPTTTTPK